MVEAVEAVARAISEKGGACDWQHALECAQAAIAAARPLIMAEAAGIAESSQCFGREDDEIGFDDACVKIAQAIRHAATPADPHEEQGR